MRVAIGSQARPPGYWRISDAIETTRRRSLAEFGILVGSSMGCGAASRAHLAARVGTLTRRLSFERPRCPIPATIHAPMSPPARQGRRPARLDRPVRTRSRVGERGSITVWLLGLAVLLLFVGGLSLDLWRATSARQLLANAADAAAIAGATGIDTARFRDTGQLTLDPSAAMQRAGDSLARQGGLPLAAPPAVEVTPDPPQVVVVLTGQVRLTLMRVLLPNQPPLTVRVRAVSVPREFQ